MLSLAELPKSCRHHDILSSNHLSVEGGTDAGVLGERYKKTHGVVLSTFLSPLKFSQNWCQWISDHRLLFS